MLRWCVVVFILCLELFFNIYIYTHCYIYIGLYICGTQLPGPLVNRSSASRSDSHLLVLVCLPETCCLRVANEGVLPSREFELMRIASSAKPHVPHFRHTVVPLKERASNSQSSGPAHQLVRVCTPNTCRERRGSDVLGSSKNIHATAVPWRAFSVIPISHFHGSG